MEHVSGKREEYREEYTVVGCHPACLPFQTEYDIIVGLEAF
jgi:hypothetical protein